MEMEAVGDDLVKEILIRCDVEDLIRCKAVCKSWLSLISDPLFIKKHLVQSYDKDDMNNVSRRIVMVSLPNGISPFLSARGSVDCFILGSCNGLVCLITPDAKHILVINPSIRHIKQLPGDLPITIPEISRLCSGFGYDSLNDDYKLILGGDHTCFHVFSLRSNLWKVVEFSKRYKIVSNVGVLYNASLHWFTTEDEDDNQVSIVSFDVSSEEFKEIPQPDDPRYEWKPYRRLGVMNGCLSMYYYGLGLDDNIWVMNNYNVKHSWELYPRYHNRKLEVIHSLYEPKNCGYKKSDIPSDGEAAAAADNKIFRQVILDFVTHKYVCASQFVKSLVSPHPCMFKGKQ